jgi:hypothetical protein
LLNRLERTSEKTYQDRSEVERQNAKLLEAFLPLMLSMKNSWRHKITHVDNRLEWLDVDYSPQIAKEIISSVRGFMCRLAAELPLRGKTIETKNV